ncbi:hypothetical protein [Neochlamydia sp. S13]|uniref:hypothetical protein n=1 Tax=Neochlamydia sp. S13 TaxID=1353976 RepID=UPI0005AAC6FE|nr:hypothetical protein [Neochlamydia sp. S13]
MQKQKYRQPIKKKLSSLNRLSNWSDYNKALVQRGSITLWFSDGGIKGWRENKSLREERIPKNLFCCRNPMHADD